MDQYPILDKNKYTRLDRLKDSGYLALFFLTGFIGGVAVAAAICCMVYGIQNIY